jgi:hypothetical protein
MRPHYQQEDLDMSDETTMAARKDGKGFSEDQMDRAAKDICLAVTGHNFTPSLFPHLNIDELLNLLTFTQYVTDLCINELERRGELKMCDECNAPIIPYMSEHGVETILTREGLQPQLSAFEH